MTFIPNGALAAPAGALTGTTLAANVVASSLTSVGTLSSLTITAGISALTIGTGKVGIPTQVSGSGAGFNLFTPVANLTYLLTIAGKDAADGNAPSNAFEDVVAVNATSGFTPLTVTSKDVLGTPGARTYSDSTGAFHIVIASGTTWYIDVSSTRFAS